MSRPGTSRSRYSALPSARDPTGVLGRTARHIHKEEAKRLLQRGRHLNDERIVSDELKTRGLPDVGPLRRVVVHSVAVPVKRQVKVPVKTKEIAPKKATRRVKVKRLVKVPGFKEVDEEYTVIKERPKKVMKEVWVKKIVEEEVMEPYEVKKTRTKTVPTEVLKEVVEWQEVEVEEDTTVDVDGFRVDEVEDQKVVEIREEQVYDLVPRLRHERRLLSARSLGPTEHQPHLSRTLGSHTYKPSEVADVPADEFPSNTAVVPAMKKHIRSRIGMVAHQIPGERRGVHVKLIRRGYPAEEAGLKAGDYITAVDGVATPDLLAFRSAIYNSPDTVSLTVTRGGSTATIALTKRPIGPDTARSNALGRSGMLTGRSTYSASPVMSARARTLMSARSRSRR